MKFYYINIEIIKIYKIFLICWVNSQNCAAIKKKSIVSRYSLTFVYLLFL